MTASTNPVHPKVKAAASVASILALIFTVLAAVGVVVPDEVQNTASVVIADIAAAIPVIVAYAKGTTLPNG